jgi:hypothetical protein
MKKALARLVLFMFSVILLAGVIPLSANAASNTSSNKTTIFKYLTEELGFNSAAACGIMANIEKESSFRPNIIIRDSNGLPSGGLCMWNGSRLNNLKKYCANKGLNYLSIEGQLSYLEYELKKDQYKHIYKYLKNVADSSKGAYNAAHYWCYYFEVPANRSSKSVQRGNTATKSYWPVYGTVELKTPKLTVAKGTTYEPEKSIKVNWTSAGDDTDSYNLYLVKKNLETGKYDYDNAKVAKLDPDKTSHTLKASNLKKGSYKVYVKAFNNITGAEEKSNVLSFTIKCPEHDYTTKITSLPTDKKDGVKTLTCKVCKDVKKEAYLLKDYFKTLNVENIEAIDVTDSTLKVTWDKVKYANGYIVYAKICDKWQKIATITSGKTEVSIKNLDSEKTYEFRVKAFRTIDSKDVYSKVSKTLAVTTLAAPKQENNASTHLFDFYENIINKSNA